MNLKHIRSFICVFEECSISRAALKLHVVQSAVSAQILDIERELNTTLFERSAKGVEATAEGRALYRLFLPVLKAFLKAEADARELIGKGVEEIRVGLSPSISNAVLSVVLYQFQREFPDVTLLVDEQQSWHLADGVRGGVIDFALMGLFGVPPNLSAVQVLEEPLVLVESRARRGTRSNKIDFRELQGLPLVLPRSRETYRRTIEEASEQVGVELNVQFEVDSAGPMFQMVAQSKVATVIPLLTAANGAKHLSLRIAHIVSPPLSRKLWCVYRPERPPTKAMERFIGLIQSNLQHAALLAARKTTTFAGPSVHKSY